ncbi:MAG: hypothetical protein R2880_03105 [Deinococcales bacterium]
MTPKRYRTRNLADLKPYINSGYYRIGPRQSPAPFAKVYRKRYDSGLALWQRN